MTTALEDLQDWLSLRKEQPTPPRPGLVFDRTVHRWKRPNELKELGGDYPKPIPTAESDYIARLGPDPRSKHFNIENAWAEVAYDAFQGFNQRHSKELTQYFKEKKEAGYYDKIYPLDEINEYMLPATLKPEWQSEKKAWAEKLVHRWQELYPQQELFPHKDKDDDLDESPTSYENYKDQGGRFGKREFEVASEYVTQGYKRINSALRKGDLLSVRAEVQALDSAIRRHGETISPTTQLWRSVWHPEKRFNTRDYASLVGTSFIDRAYTSFTSSESIAADFEDGGYTPAKEEKALFKTVEIDEDIKGLDMEDVHVFEEEEETLLPRGLKYTIVSYEESHEYGGVMPIFGLKVSRI